MAAALQRLAWRDPVEVMAAFAEEPFALLLLSGGGSAQARWSYLLRAPLRTMLFDPAEAGDPVAALVAAWRFLGQALPGAPPSTPAAFWDAAVRAWSPSRIPAVNVAPCPAGFA